MRQRKERKPIVITTIIILLMVGSIAGFLVGYNTDNQDIETIQHKGKTFTRTPQGFTTTINGNQIILLLDPQVVENIPTDSVSISNINSASKVYLSFNPEDNLNSAASYLHSNIRPHLPFPIFQACPEDIGAICMDLPIKTCENANPQEKVILLQKNEDSNTITYKNDCLVIEGKNDLIAPTQKAIQQLLGI